MNPFELNIFKNYNVPPLCVHYSFLDLNEFNINKVWTIYKMIFVDDTLGITCNRY